MWDDDRLAADRQRAIDNFVAERKAADSALWAAKFDETRSLVMNVFAATNNLRSITSDSLLVEPGMWWHVLRYCCGPPVSEEDLWTYVGGPKFKKVSMHWAEHTAEVFRVFIDAVRFPWVGAGRDPTPSELERALDATVMPLAQQRFATAGRGRASRRQEAAVAAVLATAGFDRDVERRPITTIDVLPRGSYSRERLLAGDKCDVPLRLRDGRILAIECKSSNGPKNGWKRLIREVGGKADGWRRSFGEQVMTAAVLAGVYDLSALKGAHTRGVILFWEHDLGPLVEFATSAE
ncbi:MAG TPA: XamI family restriction endonuclease [Acidimicrobiales bacterium]|nr:XamI family restriction endonuclease [Acidimicrobiales bacterium]